MAGNKGVLTGVKPGGLDLSQNVDDATIEQVNGLLQVKGGGAWTDWVPALTATSVNPTLGSGSVQTGRYTKIGRLVVARLNIGFGSSGAAAGTGTYRVSLPVAADVNPPGSDGPVGQGHIYDASADQLILCRAQLVSASTVGMQVAAVTAYNVAATVPFTWTNLDALMLLLMYEAAA